MTRRLTPLWEAAGEAWRVMRAQKLKTFFTLVGVFVGVTFLVAVVSIVEGLNRYMVDRFANALMGVNTFELRRAPSFMINGSAETWRAWQRRPPLTTDDADYVSARLRTPARLARYCSGGAPVRFGNRTATTVDLRAADASYFEARHYEIAAGRAFTPQEVRAGQPVLVIGATLADRLLPSVDPIGKEVTVGGLPYRVIGVLAKQGTLFGMPLDQLAILPLGSPMHRALCPSNIVDAVVVQTADPAQLKAAMTETETLMRSARRLRPLQENNFDFQTSESALDTWRKISRILMIALPGLAGISLVVGGIVIMNIMLVAVSERTREIGIRKALGARREDILRQFVIEAATISLVGAALGIGAGFLLAFAIKAVTPLPAAVAPWSIPAAMLLGVGVGVVAGAYPASRAARLDPITALQAE